jgi:glutamate-5-semialdehyde dehydrogenase
VNRLTSLRPGQDIVFGGDRVTTVSAELAAAFTEGDRLVVVQDTGDLLHIPIEQHELVAAAVDAAVASFAELAACSDDQITTFFHELGERLADDALFAVVQTANEADVAGALERGRSTTRLALSASMRAGMIDGVRAWRDSPIRRSLLVDELDHGDWRVETWRAPLGVVGFVFEGRPNVFADATGVLRTGNTAVFRIGSDALGTARALMAQVLRPSLAAAGLPMGAVQLVDSAAHAAGWALFSDRRLGLAVARGSGPAVAQLGSVARQHGVPASLHGTGGAWLVVAADAEESVVRRAVTHSLDRKVCNTLNTVCLLPGAERFAAVVHEAAVAAAAASGAIAVVHEVGADRHGELGHEFEWETAPELWLTTVTSLEHACELFGRHSPRFIASIITADLAVEDRFVAALDAPFVGNGFTRWVDGQFALHTPELGLSNWQGGRLLARGGVLAGDAVHTVRLRATVRNHDLHR